MPCVDSWRAIKAENHSGQIPARKATCLQRDVHRVRGPEEEERRDRVVALERAHHPAGEQVVLAARDSVRRSRANE